MFAPSLIATTNTGFWTAVYEIEQGYIRIAHRDVFGHTSPITASPAMYFLTQDIDDILTDSEFEDTMDKLEDDMTQAQADIDQAKEDILANANEILSLEEELAIQGAEISRVATIAESNEGKIASLETELVVMEGELTAMIQTNADAIVTTNEAMASMNTTLTAEIDANTAAIEQNSIVIADIDSTLSSYMMSNDAAIGDIEASVTAISEAQVNTDGTVSAIYGLQVDANGNTAGMTLGANEAGSYVDFLSDTFRIANPDNATGEPVTAFEVRDGNVMMNNAMIGNLTAEQISAGAINGSHISATSLIRAGSGVTSASLDGSNATWRLYAGHTDPTIAPFRVDTTGKLICLNADIAGVINATSGTFNGAITAQSGSIAGRLDLYQGYIDGRSGYDRLNLGNGAFRVDTNGSLFANSGTFAGTIYADKIEGDVVKAQPLAQVLDQTFVFDPSPKQRTVVINGITIMAYGGTYDSGDNTHPSTAKAYADFNINGSLYSVFTSASGSNSDSRPAGYTLVVPANQTITVNIRFWGENGQNAFWDYDARGAVVMAI